MADPEFLRRRKGHFKRDVTPGYNLVNFPKKSIKWKKPKTGTGASPGPTFGTTAI